MNFKPLAEIIRKAHSVIQKKRVIDYHGTIHLGFMNNIVRVRADNNFVTLEISGDVGESDYVGSFMVDADKLAYLATLKDEYVTVVNSKEEAVFTFDNGKFRLPVANVVYPHWPYNEETDGKCTVIVNATEFMDTASRIWMYSQGGLPGFGGLFIGSVEDGLDFFSTNGYNSGHAKLKADINCKEDIVVLLPFAAFSILRAILHDNVKIVLGESTIKFSGSDFDLMVRPEVNTRKEQFFYRPVIAKLLENCQSTVTVGKEKMMAAVRNVQSLSDDVEIYSLSANGSVYVTSRDEKINNCVAEGSSFDGEFLFSPDKTMSILSKIKAEEVPIKLHKDTATWLSIEDGNAVHFLMGMRR